MDSQDRLGELNSNIEHGDLLRQHTDVLTTQAGFIQKNAKLIEGHQGFITEHLPNKIEQNRTNIEAIRNMAKETADLLGRHTQLLNSHDDKMGRILTMMESILKPSES